MGRSPLPACALIACLSGAAAAAPGEGEPPAVVAHHVTVTLDPASGRLDGSDRMTVRRGGGDTLRLLLRDGLRVDRLAVDGERAESIDREEAPAGPGLVAWRVTIPQGSGTAEVAMTWSGTVREDVRRAGDLAFVVGDHSRGTIGPEGVFLTDATGWLPLDGSMATFEVEATVPPGWSVATQGGVPAEEAREDGTTFRFPATLAADGLWLQAGRWTVRRRTVEGDISLGTYLSEANAGLSDLLLDAVEEYLVAYRRVLGPFPHAKFDVVENFFSTGYGMPSATLLGGDVIAHIGRTAARSGGKVPPGYLDHELVHCWWGNGVFVDYASGNWCEALTTYCSNYLRKEWESAEEAARHRRGVRARFAARVAPSRDYPLRSFTGKTEDFENDIGYGKGSMLFHAVRREIGDIAFFRALRTFASRFAGKRASWDDLRAAFEASGRRRLETLFDAFLDRTGAPLVRMEGWTAEPVASGWIVRGALVQDGAPWPLVLPLVIETARGTVDHLALLREARLDMEMHVDAPPLRVRLDPDGHVWRAYAPGEIPATLDAALHDPAGLRVLAPREPESTGERAPSPWEIVAGALEGRPGVERRDAGPPDGDGGGGSPVGEAPDRSLLLLGPAERNPSLGAFTEHLQRLGLLTRTRRGLSVMGHTVDGEGLAVLLSFRHPADPSRFVTLFTAGRDEDAASARRLFFYGGDGAVVFQGGRPVLRVEAEGDASSTVSLLPSLFPAPGIEERIDGLVRSLAALDGRRAGTDGDRAATALLRRALGAEDGLSLIEQPVEFDVVDWAGSGSAPCAEPLAGVCIPFAFSPPTEEWTSLPGEAPLRVDASTTPEAFLSALQRRFEERPGPVLVAGPPEPPPAVADWLLHPSALPVAEATRLRDRAAAGGEGDPTLFVAGRRARLLAPDFPVPAPVIYLATEPERSALPARVRSPLTSLRVATVNLLAALEPAGEARSDGAVLVSAHHDHLGPGFPGADDNASGVAALREAGRALVARRAQLRRPVVLALFGAEEWGLRGSTAFAKAPPPGLPRVLAALNLDTVGHAGNGRPSVIGRSVYPGLAAVADRCLAAAELPPGPDIDRFAFAWGSDHYALHAAGIPALDWFAGDYRSMHTTADTADTVDAGKVARLARAAAAWVLALSSGEVPR